MFCILYITVRSGIIVTYCATLQQTHAVDTSDVDASLVPPHLQAIDILEKCVMCSQLWTSAL